LASPQSFDSSAKFKVNFNGVLSLLPATMPRVGKRAPFEWSAFYSQSDRIKIKPQRSAATTTPCSRCLSQRIAETFENDGELFSTSMRSQACPLYVVDLSGYDQVKKTNQLIKEVGI